MHNIILKDEKDMQKAKDLLVKVFNPGYYEIEGNNKIIFKSKEAHEVGGNVLKEIGVDMILADAMNAKRSEQKFTRDDYSRVVSKAMDLVSEKKINLTDLATIELRFGQDQTIPEKYQEVMADV